MIGSRRGVILPVVLMVMVLLSLMGAMFAFRVNADLAATQVVAERLQTRLAAEAGIDRVKLLLRDGRFDMDQWYHNPDDLHRVIVWVDGGNESTWGSNEEFEGDEMAYRFSIVADDPTDDEDFIRFGITDEASKLNLNTATEVQLLKLVGQSVGENDEIDPRQIVNAILDWRDTDSTPRGEPGDTEGPFYRTLPKPYLVKNGPFDTVEELLLVKGVTGQILYGEDFDRNGLLTPNEDDGDDSFPPDNEDNKLNRGLYPYLTVHSSENNVDNENRPRVYLHGDASTLQAGLETVFPDRPEVVQFIIQTAGQSRETITGQGGGGSRRPGGRGGGRRGNNATGGNPSGGDGDGSGGGAEGDGQTGNKESGPIQTPASLLAQTAGGRQTLINPLSMEDLPTLMDRLTAVPSEQQSIAGLINVNTAPPQVLRCVEGLNEEQIEALVETRVGLASEEKMTTAWLVLEEVVDFETYEKIAPQITARGQQFTIESLGYADHVGMVTRLQVIVDLVGPIAQTVYYRDMSYLGGHFPIREEDLERVRAR